MTKFKEVERIGFGVLADSNKRPYIFSHSDRFWVVDLKNRKEVIYSEYRPNPYAEICRNKYSKPSVIGDNPEPEELEIYLKMAQILSDCDTVWGYNYGNYVMLALEGAGTDPIMTDREPEKIIQSLIDARRYAGYRD